MEDVVYQLVKRLRPDLEKVGGQQRMGGVADVITLMYTLPLGIIGLAWLVKVSEWGVIGENWLFFVILAVLMYLFNRFSFFLVTEIRSGGYANTQGALDGMVLWSGIFLFGPSALWLDVFWNVVNLVRGLWQTRHPAEIWNRLRASTSGLAMNLFGILLVLPIYRLMGGEFPLGELTMRSLLAGTTTILLHFMLTLLIFSGYMGYIIWALRYVLHNSPGPAIYFFILAFALPALANPFAILAANLYSQGGILFYLFDMIGLLLVAALARRLSQAAESNRLQSRQLKELERLGRAILNSPPDASTLPALLEEHVPPMFSSSSILIWSQDNGTLLNYPPESRLEKAPVWNWLHRQNQAGFFQAKDDLPWLEKSTLHAPLLVAPILHTEHNHAIGGVYIELHTLAVMWDAHSLAALLPAVQTLSAQVASALHRAQVYHETLAMQKTLQELSLARTIQASFLPEVLPQMDGWQLHAALEPARQIAGDFYDFISLPDGQVGIVIADVADKGLGPALYMALSSTLLRTFASQYPSEPARVLSATNQRILQDAHANLFVTVFYGVLNPISGQMTYANAGHPPALIIGGEQPVTQRSLRNTGMPLGIDPEATWRDEIVQLPLGYILMLYTDGVTDAQNSRGEFIDRQSVLKCVYERLEQPVQIIQQSIFDEIHNFVGEAPRFDDITLVLVRREFG
ncbi:MAG: PP2C family protein-serine/threonine phosphatase [Anaerolineales bacterium]|nr:PP2C family protein-serine/threonine phosphatase [Anaerolineales bacterium]